MLTWPKKPTDLKGRGWGLWAGGLGWNPWAGGSGALGWGSGLSPQALTVFPCPQEALHRELLLKQKMVILQELLSTLLQASEKSWQVPELQIPSSPPLAPLLSEGGANSAEKGELALDFSLLCLKRFLQNALCFQINTKSKYLYSPVRFEGFFLQLAFPTGC